MALDKIPGVHSIGIWETLRWYLAKPIMREDGDQANTVWGNMELCAGLEAGIEGVAYAVGKRERENEWSV